MEYMGDVETLVGKEVFLVSLADLLVSIDATSYLAEKGIYSITVEYCTGQYYRKFPLIAMAMMLFPKRRTEFSFGFSFPYLQSIIPPTKPSSMVLYSTHSFVVFSCFSDTSDALRTPK